MVNHLVELLQHFIDRVMCFYCPVNVFGEADNFRYILLFTIKTDTSVQGDTVNPCRYFTFFPEFRISFPEVQYYILIEVVERTGLNTKCGMDKM